MVAVCYSPSNFDIDWLLTPYVRPERLSLKAPKRDVVRPYEEDKRLTNGTYEQGPRTLKKKISKEKGENRFQTRMTNLIA
jgi:hypothetical protein